MDFGVPPVGTPHTGATRPAGDVRRTPGPGPDFQVTLSQSLDGPPAELRPQLEAAGRRWEELQAMQRELHFEVHPASGRIVVEVRDLDGHVLRTVPPSTALEIAAGAPLP